MILFLLNSEFLEFLEQGKTVRQTRSAKRRVSGQGIFPEIANLTVYRARFAYALRGYTRLLPEDAPIDPVTVRGRSSAVRGS